MPEVNSHGLFVHLDQGANTKDRGRSQWEKTGQRIQDFVSK